MTGIGSGACSPLMTGTAATQTSAKKTINSPGNLGNPVVLIESPGYDTTEIQTFITNGDQEGVKEWMQTFMGEHRDDLPSPPGVA
jgi:hypothetical protein